MTVFRSSVIGRSLMCSPTRQDDMPLTLARKTLLGVLLVAVSGIIAGGAVYLSIHHPHTHPFSVKDSLIASGHPLCKRKPLSFGPLRPPEERTYTTFDDVLLVVFFSHARYDVNLDYYREVYAEYFPNVRKPVAVSCLLSLSDSFYSSIMIDGVYRSREPRGRGLLPFV